MSYEPLTYESWPRFLARTSILWIFFAALAVAAVLAVLVAFGVVSSSAPNCPPGTVAQTSGGVLNANADSEMTACVKR